MDLPKLSSDRDFKGRVKSYLERQEKFKDTDTVITGISTGIDGLDEATLGIQNTDFWVVQGRTGIGKTYLLCFVAHHMRMQGRHVLLVNREMEPEHVHGRIDSLAANFSYHRWRKGKMEKKELRQYVDFAKSDVPGRIDVVPPVDKFKPATLKKLAHSFKDRHGENIVVIVDYINRVESDSDDFDNIRAMRNISDSLKDLAYKDRIPVFAAAQTNRSMLYQKATAPGTEHIYGGDVLGWNADLVLSLYRTDQMFLKKEMGLMMVKYRHGEEMDIVLNWDLENGIISEKSCMPRGEIRAEMGGEETE